MKQCCYLKYKKSEQYFLPRQSDRTLTWLLFQQRIVQQNNTIIFLARQTTKHRPAIREAIIFVIYLGNKTMI